MILQTTADVPCGNGEFRLVAVLIWDGLDDLLCNYNCVTVLWEKSLVTSYS